MRALSATSLLAVFAFNGCDDPGITRNNQPPSADITWPLDDAEHPQEEPLTIVAMAGDDLTENADLEVRWISTRSGELEGQAAVDDAAVMLTVAELMEGDHTVRVEVTDGEGAMASDEVRFSVIPNAGPTVEILQPSSGDRFVEGETIVIAALVSDDDDALNELELLWGGTATSEDLPETPDSDGDVLGHLLNLAPGSYTLELEVIDPVGATAIDSVAFDVDEAEGPVEPVTVSLSDAAWKASGTGVDDNTGEILGAGDLTGDGVLDLVVGSPSGNYSEPDEKEIYVFAGPLGSGAVLADTADAMVLAPLSEGLGTSLAADHDLTGDGQPDLVAAHYPVPDFQVLLFEGPLLGSYDASGASAVLSGPGGEDYFGYFGLDASIDLSGDGVVDLIVSAPGQEVDGVGWAGAVHLFEGPITGDLDVGSAVATLVGEPIEYGGLGYDVSGPGDLNGDGIGELLAAASEVTTSAQYAGWILMVEGPVSGTLDAADVDAWVFGSGYCDYLGRDLEGAGDVDGDGYDDWLAGAFFATRDLAEQGAAYLFTDVEAGMSGDADDLATAVLLGEEADNLAGNAVLGISDLDGDGWDDFAIGAYREDTVGYDVGAVYVLPGPVSGTVDLGSAPWKIVGEYVNDEAGAALAAGELDGDGLIDLAIGAPKNDTSANYGGAVYLMSGAMLLE